MLWLWTSTAWATWSIVAVDAETGEVGVAGATCSPYVWMIGEVAPGHGAVVAQYATNLKAKRTAVERLSAGELPTDILADITALDVDPDVADRQYAIVSFAGPSATYTGENAEEPTLILSDAVASVQGNTLASESVVTEAWDVWLEGEGDRLEDRLYAALEAGAAEGGDDRCEPDIAAKSAFLMVADAAGVVVDVHAGCGSSPAVETLGSKLHGNGCATVPGRGPWALAVLLLASIRRCRISRVGMRGESR